MTLLYLLVLLLYSNLGGSVQLFDFGVTAGDELLQQFSPGELTVMLQLPKPLFFGGENYSLIRVSGIVVK